jgi:hypothetical protein
MLVVLDDEDLANPEDTIKLYKMGVDTNFLVDHLGGGADYIEQEEEEEEPELAENEMIRSITDEGNYSTPG